MKESKHSTNVLRLWLQQNNRNPYPNKTEKTLLAVEANLTLTHVVEAIFCSLESFISRDVTHKVTNTNKTVTFLFDGEKIASEN